MFGKMKDKLYKNGEAKMSPENEMMYRALKIEYDKMRIDYIYSQWSEEQRTPRAHRNLCNLIYGRKRLIPRLRRSEGLHPGDGYMCSLEIILSKRDKELMLKQLLDKGYEPEMIKIILNNIKRDYSSLDHTFICPKLKDYNIDEIGNVSLKPMKERYDELLKDQYQQALDEGMPYGVHHF